MIYLYGFMDIIGGRMKIFKINRYTVTVILLLIVFVDKRVMQPNNLDLNNNQEFNLKNNWTTISPLIQFEIIRHNYQKFSEQKFQEQEFQKYNEKYWYVRLFYEMTFQHYCDIFLFMYNEMYFTNFMGQSLRDTIENYFAKYTIHDFQRFTNAEEQIFDKLTSYYENLEHYDNLEQNQLQIQDADIDTVFYMLYASYKSFWVLVNLRLCSMSFTAHFQFESKYMKNFEYYNYLKKKCDFYFEFIKSSIFDDLPLIVENFREQAIMYGGREYGSVIEDVTNELLKLNLDFIMDEDTIQNVDDVTHANGIIRFSEINETQPNGKSYKSIFTSVLDKITKEYKNFYFREDTPYIMLDSRVYTKVDKDVLMNVLDYFFPKINGKSYPLNIPCFTFFNYSFEASSVLWKELNEEYLKINPDAINALRKRIIATDIIREFSKINAKFKFSDVEARLRGFN